MIHSIAIQMFDLFRARRGCGGDRYYQVRRFVEHQIYELGSRYHLTYRHAMYQHTACTAGGIDKAEALQASLIISISTKSQTNQQTSLAKH